MDYASLTFKDPNAIKRWLQRQRLHSALKLTTGIQPRVICDFGGGNGELLKMLSPVFPDARLICYEPTPRLLAEARGNLNSVPNVLFTGSVQDVAPESVDILFCLEVFEHLPEKETGDTLAQIKKAMQKESVAVFGVPVEIGIPALYKGLFRMSRRFGAYDANFPNVLRAVVGRPPKERPCGEIAPGFRYHFAHMGFDYRRFQKISLSILTSRVLPSVLILCGVPCSIQRYIFPAENSKKPFF